MACHGACTCRALELWSKLKQRTTFLLQEPIPLSVSIGCVAFSWAQGSPFPKCHACSFLYLCKALSTMYWKLRVQHPQCEFQSRCLQAAMHDARRDSLFWLLAFSFRLVALFLLSPAAFCLPFSACMLCFLINLALPALDCCFLLPVSAPCSLLLAWYCC